MNSLPGMTMTNWPWWKKAIAIGGTLLLLFVLWWVYIAHTIHDKLTVWLTLVIPVDPIVTTLIADLLFSAFYFALLPGFISRILFGISKQVLWGTFVLVLVSVTVVNLTLGRDVFFGKDGQPRLFYVMRPDEGLVVTGNQTPDPTTGDTPRPISREIVPSIRAMYRGRSPGVREPTEIDEKHLFDPSTGRALVWYHRDASGAIKLYDGPGFDPESQDPLRPVTKELVPSVKGYIQNEKAALAERKRVEAKAALADRNRSAAQEPAERQRASDEQRRRIAEEQQRAVEEQGRRLAEQAALQEKQALTQALRSGLRDYVEQYAKKAGQKALAVAVDRSGRYAAGEGSNFSLQGDANARALAECRSRLSLHNVSADCRLYAVGQEVIW